MSEKINESISALMDSEANELELERILNQSRQAEVRDAWQRYHLVSHSLRGGRLARGLDVSSAVMRAIEAEDTAADVTPRERARRFRVKEILRPAARLLIAAAVFAMVMMGGQWYSLVGAGRGDEAGAQVAAQSSPGGMVNTLDGAARNVSYATSPARTSRGRQLSYNQLAHQQLLRYLWSDTGKVAGNWRVNWVPQGFSSTGHGGGQGLAQTFSNGQTVFSVYLERLEQPIEPGEGRAQRGGATSYTRGIRLTGQPPILVTVIGEVPLNTARLVADSVTWGPAP